MQTIYNIVKAPVGWCVFCDGVRLGGYLRDERSCLRGRGSGGLIFIRDGQGIQINVPEDPTLEEGQPSKWDDLLRP